MKSKEQLFDIYCKSVGLAGAMDLGISPMKEGILHPKDVKTSASFGKLLKRTFAHNLALNSKITLSNIRYNNRNLFGEDKLTDSDGYSYWATDDTVQQASAEFEFKHSIYFNLIRLRENIKLGQRIDSVGINVFSDGQWHYLTSVTSIGANRIVKLPEAEKAEKIKIRFHAPVSITLSDIGFFLEPNTRKRESESNKK